MRPFPQADPLVARELLGGSTVHVRGIPVKLASTTRVGTTPGNWRLATRETNTGHGHAAHTEKWKRCTRKVKNVSNKYAICTASLGGKSFKK